MCDFMPNLPDSTKLSQRRGGRYYGDEQGGERGESLVELKGERG